MNMEGHCHVEVVERKPSFEELADISEAKLLVSGMGCANCALRVRNALVMRQGVVDAQVDHSSGQALVHFNPGMLGLDDLIDAVSTAGNGSHHRYRATHV